MYSIDVFILAGGQGRRMGYQDKGLVCYQNKRLIQHVIDKLKPQSNSIHIIANQNMEAYESFGYPVFEDVESGFQGPLMGMLTAMTHSKADAILFVPCDTPHLPPNLLLEMTQKLHRTSAEIVVAIDDTNKEHAVTCLTKRSLKGELAQFLKNGNRKVMLWNHSRNLASVSFEQAHFLNVNSL
ncbi:molybdenum cofactor guanylyltransferase [Shewanella sp. OPT22]|nr:molybdenum cofactor guanylyltransferase [Shewanella sp. OPT22]